MGFVECDTCRAKPGTPVLCKGCLHNRMTIRQLQERIDLLTDTTSRFTAPKPKIYADADGMLHRTIEIVEAERPE